MSRAILTFLALSLPLAFLSFLGLGCMRIEVSHEERERRDAVVMTFEEVDLATKSAILKSMLEQPGSHGGRWEGDDLVVFMHEEVDHREFRRALRDSVPEGVVVLGTRIDEERVVREEKEGDDLLPRYWDHDAKEASGENVGSEPRTRRGTERGTERGPDRGTERGPEK